MQGNYSEIFQYGPTSFIKKQLENLQFYKKALSVVHDSLELAA